MLNKIVILLNRIFRYVERNASEIKALELSGKKVVCLGPVTFNTSKIIFGENIILYSGVKLWGENIEIGTQTIVLKGARIGNGAVIGANSVVNSNIPANAISFGCPAKVYGYRK